MKQETKNNFEEPPPHLNVQLMEGEELILSLRPDKKGFVRYFWMSALLMLSFTIVGLPFTLIVCPIAWVYGRISRSKYHYWLTNRRVIWSSGFIGYQTSSVPLERVSDVVLSNTIFEMAAGIQSLDIHDMTGQRKGNLLSGAVSEVGNIPDWIAVNNASAVQSRILEEVQRVNQSMGSV